MKGDKDKTKEQLLKELEERRRKITRLERLLAESRQVEDTLRVREQQLSVLFDRVADVIFTLSVGPDDCYRFTMVNRRFLEVTGLSENQVVGKRIEEVIPEPAHALVLGKYQEAIQTGQSVHWEETSIYPAGEKTGEVNVAPILDAKGNCTHLIGTVHDITERKRVEKALQKSEERYRTLIATSPDGIAIVGIDGLVSFASRKILELFGYQDESEVIGLSPMGWIAKGDRERARTNIGKVFKGTQVGRNQYRLTKKNGTSFWGEIHSSVMSDGKGDPIGLVAIIQDITERKHMEKALRRSEESFKQLSETTFEGVAIHEKGKILLANSSFARMFGYEIREVIGKNALDLTTQEYRPLVMKNIMSGYEKPYDAIGLRKDGSTFIGELRGSPVHYKGRWLRSTAIRDITERKQIEDRLRETEQNFRNSLNDSPLGIRIITEHGDLLYANKAILDIYGYRSIEELETIPTRERYTPESYAEHQKRKELRQQGKPMPSNYEISIMRKDGETRHLAVSHNEVAWNGKTQFQAVYQDITELNKTKVKLEQAAEEWQTTFDSINDMISVHNKDHRIVMVNKAWTDTFKMPPQAFIGKHCYELLHGTGSPPSNCPLRRTLKTGNTELMEMFEPHIGRWIQVSTSLILDKNREVMGVVHSIRDVSNEKKLQEQLMAQDRLASIGQLVSGVAHELNNPLTSVIGFSDMLLHRDLPDDVKADLKIVRDEANRTGRIVKNLLTFVRTQPEGKMPEDINENIKGVLILRDHEQSINSIKVNTQFAPNLPKIMGNSSQLQQVFFNIVVNAEQAMLEAHNRGTLTITTKRAGHIVQARLTDDGPGISPKNMNRLFTPFFTTKDIGKGTGLGLSICHGIITEHGGKIYAESEPGKGATFIVELPVIPKQVTTEKLVG